MSTAATSDPSRLLAIIQAQGEIAAGELDLGAAMGLVALSKAPTYDLWQVTGPVARVRAIAPDGTVTAYAGAGIVVDSDPEQEMLETRMKFRPIIDAFA